MNGLYELRQLLQPARRQNGEVVLIEGELLRVSTPSGVRTVRNTTSQQVAIGSEVVIEGNQLIGAVSKQTELKVYSV